MSAHAFATVLLPSYASDQRLVSGFEDDTFPPVTVFSAYLVRKIDSRLRPNNLCLDVCYSQFYFYATLRVKLTTFELR